MNSEAQHIAGILVVLVIMMLSFIALIQMHTTIANDCLQHGKLCHEGIKVECGVTE